jgi:hypothetical protein
MSKNITNINNLGISALKRAKAQVSKKCKLGINYCLYNVQEWYKTEHVYSSAKSQWDNIAENKKHRGDKNPPNGVPVFFLGGAFGHIAIATGTNQNVVSTDLPNKGYIGISTIEKVEKAWGYKYLGWSESISKNDICYTKAPANTQLIYKTYKAKIKTKVFIEPNLKKPLVKNGKKIFRDKGYKITATAFGTDWVKTLKGNFYYKKRFKQV